MTLSVLLLNSCGNDKQKESQNTAVDRPSGPVRQPPEPQDDFGKAIEERCTIAVDEITKYFADEKSINKRDAGTGQTPLMAAARCNNLPVVKYLLTKGAQPNDVWQIDALINGYPSLWFAVNWDNAPMVKALLDAGADPRLRPTSGPLGSIIHFFARTGSMKKALEELLKADKTLANWKIGMGTPLHQAANAQRIDNIKLLLRYGADKTLTDSEGYTPWHWANAATKKAVPELQP